MTGLPVCKLCKTVPVYYVYKSDKLYFCGTTTCRMHGLQFNESDWRRLMYVPAKRAGLYSEAVDDMLRGGE